MKTDISVVIAAYNAENYIGAAIETVIAQKATPMELVVVDDGSGDATSEIVRGYAERAPFPIKLLKQVNAGLPAARNVAIKETKGTWIAFLDADDLWEPEHLLALKSQPFWNKEAGVLFTNSYNFTNDGELSENTTLEKKCLLISEEKRGEYHILRKSLFAEIVKGNFIPPSCTAVRRDIGDAENWFDERIKKGSDRDLFLRLSTRARFIFFEKETCGLRVHDGNMSGGSQADRSAYILRALRTLYHTPYRERLSKYQRRALYRAYNEEISTHLYRASLQGFSRLMTTYLEVWHLYPSFAAFNPKHLIRSLINYLLWRMREHLLWQRVRHKSLSTAADLVDRRASHAAHDTPDVRTERHR